MNSDEINADQKVKNSCITCDTTCQRCQKGKMLHVVFGYITNQMLEDEAAGRYALGGCLKPSGPVHRCSACRASVGGDELTALWRKSRS
jgi:hypothetical protein